MKIGTRTFEFGKRTYIMGILNVTPDSFSGDGLYGDLEKAVERGRQFVEEGADLLDVGGESTRPGSEPVSVEEESQRVLPVIKRLVEELDVPISIDTYKSAVAERALALGASMVNDISGLRWDPKMVEVVAKHKVPVVIMHVKGRPKDMQQNPVYQDVVSEILEFLQNQIQFAQRGGINPEKIIIDPGIGFGKTVEHNLEILRRLKEFKSLGKPILVGTSRKSFIGHILGLPVEERLEGTAATVAIAIAHGANIIRVHDVKAMARVAKMTDALLRTEITPRCPEGPNKLIWGISVKKLNKK